MEEQNTSTSSQQQMTAALATLGTLDMKVDMESVIAIKIAEREGQIKDLIAITRKSIDATTKKLRELGKDLEKSCMDAIVKEFGEKSEAITKALNASGLWNPIAHKFTLSINSKSDTFTASVNWEFKNQHGHNYLQLNVQNVSRPFSPEQKAIIAETDKTQQTLDALNTDLNQLRSKQASLGSDERAVRAALAKAKLNSTDDGKALLAVIDGIILPKLMIDAPQEIKTEVRADVK